MTESDGPIQNSNFADLVRKVICRLLQEDDDAVREDPLGHLLRIAGEVDPEWERHVPIGTDARTSAAIVAAYEALPNGQRQLLYMHIHDDLSYAQIGQRTGLGASAALRALVRSYSALLAACSGNGWAKLIDEPRSAVPESLLPGSAALEEEVFTAALALPAAERARYLLHACEGDPALRARVSALLEGFERSVGAAARLAAMTVEGVGDSIDNFELLEEIGEGGFGVVFLAEQVVPIRREVALKVIKQGMDTRAVIARFEGERQTLAMMDHPNIAKVFDAGATPSGRPYFVMELVRGIRITDFCNQTRLTISDRLALLVQVCHAIQHAHQRAVIHRDIKPSNVLVTLCDGVPTAKVIDFGIAKAMQGRLVGRSSLTAVERFVGTPIYTSPEQTEHGEVDARSDIFSLGVLLYELLTGYTPREIGELAHLGMDELRRRIRSEKLLWPSKRLRMLGRARLDQVAQRYRTTGQKLVRNVQGDLEWVVMRCLEKDPARRYQSVTELRLDIEHYLRDEPVRARPRRIASTFVRFARRHRTVFAAAATIIVILLAAAAIAIWLALREARSNGMSQQVIDFRDATAGSLARRARPDQNLALALDDFERRIALQILQQRCGVVRIEHTAHPAHRQLIAFDADRLLIVAIEFDGNGADRVAGKHEPTGAPRDRAFDVRLAALRDMSQVDIRFIAGLEPHIGSAAGRGRIRRGVAPSRRYLHDTIDYCNTRFPVAVAVHVELGSDRANAGAVRQHVEGTTRVVLDDEQCLAGGEPDYTLPIREIDYRA
jgi:serine/threonine protein kinase